MNDFIHKIYRTHILKGVEFDKWERDEDRKPAYVLVDDFATIDQTKYEWCIENLDGEVLPLSATIFEKEYGLDKHTGKGIPLITQTIWLFEKKEEAAAFKLRWT